MFGKSLLQSAMKAFILIGNTEWKHNIEKTGSHRLANKEE